ncbi:hypothetical protein EK904_002719 [Melospiza melodia maxima]|nr:hypothetical protein EK904_002719 [Melospiza melodia maxima]
MPLLTKAEDKSWTLHSALVSEPDLEKGLEMRKWVLSGILASEETYLSHLEALLLPMKPLKAAATTSQPVLTSQQIETIFFKVPELYEIHKEFYDGLFPRVQQWSHQQRVGDLFQKLASQLGVYRAFVDNYEVAMETAEKCCQANAQFAEISENLKARSTKESKDQTTKNSLETLLYKPVDRVTRSTLVLHDLLKHTPVSHPDHPLLQDALRISQNFLSSINEEITPRRQSMTVKKGEHRQLLKDSFMVELVEGARKLRHVFLFTDLFLCAKLKKQIGGKSQQYDCKWYIPLTDLSFQMVDESEAVPNIPLVPDEELDAMKIKISQIKNDIQREKRANKGSKVIERLKKKLSEQESLLLLMSPNMAFRVHNRNGKSYTFLISSDYERAEWRENIREQQKKCFKSFSLTSVELQMLTNSCVKLQTVHNIPLTINKEDDESPGLYGFLNVIVHSATGFKQSSNLYCTLEVDSFGYFVNKAKTRVYRDTTEPNWNEEFEIELEGSQTLRILCYEKCYNKTKLTKEDGESTDRIMGKGQIQLDPQALQDKDWQRTVISMNGVEVKLSVKFTSREFSLKRMPSRKQTGVFGVKIAIVTKRERSKVPYIVRQCVEEIERRGMEEVGIYRVSGVATDIQALKAAFDVNNKDVSVMMSEMDVNAIAGTLKLYFRELPEPLFTDELYPNFAEGIALSDPVAKESCMLNLLLSLPEPNLVTFLFLLDHLKRVAERESVNKMSLHNLATVFGPTLLRPSEKDSKIPANPTQPITMTDSWSLEVMSQVQVLLYFLQLETIPTPDSKRQSILFSTEVTQTAFGKLCHPGKKMTGVSSDCSWAGEFWPSVLLQFGTQRQAGENGEKPPCAGRTRTERRWSCAESPLEGAIDTWTNAPQNVVDILVRNVTEVLFEATKNSIALQEEGEEKGLGSKILSAEIQQWRNFCGTPSSSTKDLAKHQFFISLPKSVEATGVEKAAGFVQGIESAGLSSCCAKHPGGGSNAIVLKYSSPNYSYPAMQHPFSGICPSSSWLEVQLEHKGRDWHNKGREGEMLKDW